MTEEPGKFSGVEALLGELSDGFVVVDRSGLVLRTNRGQEPLEAWVAARLSALPRGVKVLHLSGRPYVAAEWPLARALASGESVVDEEFYVIAADGNRRSFSCSCAPFYDDQGRVVGAVSVARDVTERNHARAQLAYLLPLLDAAEDAIVAADAEWRVTAWNRGAERLYGWTAEEALAQLPDFVRVDWGDEADRRRQLSERGRWRGEGIAERKDGSKVAIEAVAVALRDPGGGITGYLGIHRDVTDRKRSEEQLRYHASLLDNTLDAVIATDAVDFRITAWNPGAERLYGFSAEEAMGRPAREVASLPGDESWLKLEQELLETGRARIEFEARRKDRSLVSVELIAVAMKDDRGEVNGYLGIHRDVTKRKQAAEELERTLAQQAAVAQLGLKALEDGGLRPLMDEAVALVSRTLGVEYAKVDELLSSGEGLLVAAGVRWPEGVVGSCVLPLGRASPSGYALLVGEPVIVEDMTAETRFEVPAILREHGVLSYITVVIDPRGEAFGTLAAASTERRTFSEHDVSFVQSLANVMASAVERAQAEDRLEAAREAERSRIARDLHDEALSGLANAVALTQRAASAASLNEAAEPVGQLLPMLAQVSEQIRAAVYDLRLAGAEHKPFIERLESLVAMHRAMAAGSDLKILHQVRGRPLGSLDRRGTELLRIIGEALTNARRHSGASTINLVLDASDEQLGIEVSDDGRGFDTRAVADAGTGIRGMRERAAMIGAELTLDSRQGAGALVRVQLPLAPPAIRGRPARVLLVEDHATVSQAIAAAFEREQDVKVIGQAGSLNEARQMLEHVDVAIIDLALPDGYGADLIPELRERSPQAQALVLTASLDRAEIARAVQSGAAGVINKTVPLPEVLADVRRLRAGEALMVPDEVAQLLRFPGRERDREYRDRRAAESLTVRERDVLQALADGLNNQQIADRLGITVRTVHNHVANILTKLGVHSRLQALVFALRYDLVKIQ
ncbi:MAG: PAS domain S-box protein [Solirubrobacteraceae bacterium]